MRTGRQAGAPTIVCVRGQGLHAALPPSGHREVEGKHDGQDGADRAARREEQQLRGGGRGRAGGAGGVDGRGMADGAPVSGRIWFVCVMNFMSEDPECARP